MENYIPASKHVISMDKNALPAARVAQGSTICFETKDCFGNTLKNEQTPFTTVSWDCINPATGPVYIEGAQPGDTLKVEIIQIEVAEKGVIAAAPGFGAMPQTVDTVTRLVNIKNGHANFCWPNRGTYVERSLPIRPMIGVIGVAPAGEAVPTGTPDLHGGNMDCKRIVAGSTLYLPVFAKGALLSLGDLHAVMGDGEVVVCGLEIAGQVTVRCTVIKSCSLPTPFLADGSEVMTIGSAKTLDAAATLATQMMQDFLVKELGFDRTAAGMLLSVEGNLCICQVVDPLKTARMEISCQVLEQCGYCLP